MYPGTVALLRAGGKPQNSNNTNNNNNNNNNNMAEGVGVANGRLPDICCRPCKLLTSG